MGCLQGHGLYKDPVNNCSYYYYYYYYCCYDHYCSFFLSLTGTSTFLAPAAQAIPKCLKNVKPSYSSDSHSKR